MSFSRFSRLGKNKNLGFARFFLDILAFQDLLRLPFYFPGFSRFSRSTGNPVKLVQKLLLQDLDLAVRNYTVTIMKNQIQYGVD